MEIQTTININKIILDELSNASSTLKLSRTYIIRLVLKQFLEDNNKITIFNSAVKFQRRDERSNWSKFHLTLRQDEYELCLDMKKIYKMSVSYIIAIAIKKYLGKIMHLLLGKAGIQITDNYLFHNYLFSFRIIDGIRIFTVYWGITNFNNIITDNYQNII